MTSKNVIKLYYIEVSTGKFPFNARMLAVYRL